MLSAVERTRRADRAHPRRARSTCRRIPYDDPATYECIQNADTTGVFQIESRAQMQSLRRTRPENLKDLTIQVAIVRPGPIQGGAVNPYIERRQRLRVDPDYQVPYEHPSLEPVLRETLGTIIFQDQVLEVAIAFAGFSPGEAEGLRRAMSRKRSDAAIEAYHERFVRRRARKHGVDDETAERVFAMVEGFSGFGFPKAHGAAFGLLAYQSTWLRVHYGPSSCARCSTSSRWASTRPTRSSMRPSGGGSRCWRRTSTRAVERECRDGRRERQPCRIGARLRSRCATEQEVDGSWSRSARRAGGSGASPISPRARARVPSALEMLAWSGACDSLVPAAGGVGIAAPHRALAARGGDARTTACPAASSWRSRWICRRRPRLRNAVAVGVDARRLRHHRADRARASDRAAARPATGRRGHEPRPRDAAPRHPRPGGRAGGRPPAPGHRQRDRVRAARGRVRDDQPDRARRRSTSATG